MNAQVALSNEHKQFMCCEDNGSCVWNRNAIGGWETMNMEIILRGPISLQGYSGKTFVSCHDHSLGRQGDVVAQNVNGPWEKLIPVQVGPNRYQFKSVHGTWVCLNGNKLKCHHSNPETFQVGLGEHPGMISIRSESTNKLLSEHDNADGIYIDKDVTTPIYGHESWFVKYHGTPAPLLAKVQPSGPLATTQAIVRGQPGLLVSMNTHINKYVRAFARSDCCAGSEQPGSEEVFFMTTQGNAVSFRGHHGEFLGEASSRNVSASGSPYWFNLDKIDEHKCSLKSPTGKFLATEMDQRVTATRDGVGAWEVFNFRFHLFGNFGLRSYFNKNLCCQYEVGELIANRDSIGGWETFTAVEVAPSHFKLQGTQPRAQQGNFYVGANASDNKMRGEIQMGNAQVFELVHGKEVGTVGLKLVGKNDNGKTWFMGVDKDTGNITAVPHCLEWESWRVVWV